MFWFFIGLGAVALVFLGMMLAYEYWHRSQRYAIRTAMRYVDIEYEQITRESSR